MSRHDHHQPCPCGDELADECPRCARSNPLGSMRLDPIAETGLRNVRAALAIAPRTKPAPDDTTTHGRALARARTERTKDVTP